MNIYRKTKITKLIINSKTVSHEYVKDGLKLNGTHQLLVYADDVNILGGSIYTVNENVEALVVAN
jgi:hypothetical protein